MATITRYPFYSLLRAETNQYILHFTRGHLKRKGAGIAYWFDPMYAAIAQVPTDDRETTFVLNERTGDFQEVSVQCSVTFRVANPEAAAGRINFSISTKTGSWLDVPFERLATVMSQRAQNPARAFLSANTLAATVQQGAAVIQAKLAEALAADGFFQDLGLAIVGVQVVKVAPTAEMERALQTPTREAIQQKADQATFERRAMAVEKERAIKENELATELELARRNEDLIRQRGSNRLREVEQEAEAELANVKAKGDRSQLEAESYASSVRVRAAADADAKRAHLLPDTEAEAARVRAYAEAPPSIALAMAMREAAQRIKTVNNLNVTPDLLGNVLTEFLQERGKK